MEATQTPRFYCAPAHRRFYIGDTSPGMEATGKTLAEALLRDPSLPETAPEARAFRAAYVAAMEAGMEIEEAGRLARRIQTILRIPHHYLDGK